jgi:hypothetical protein
VTKAPKENRSSLHAVLNEIQEWLAGEKAACFREFRSGAPGIMISKNTPGEKISTGPKHARSMRLLSFVALLWAVSRRNIWLSEHSYRGGPDHAQQSAEGQ